LVTFETTADRRHTLQPFQSCFAYVVSGNIKGGL
jgi:hypothetical protein